MKKGIAECNFTDQLLPAHPLSYIITHKGVVCSVTGPTGYIISVDYTCSLLNVKLVRTRKLNLYAS